MDETRAGFYFTDKLTVTLNLINKNNGLAFQFIKVFPDIQPRYHYKLKFDTTDSGDEAAGGNIDITVNEELEEIGYTIKLPKYTQLMDLPKAPSTQIATQFAGEQNESGNSSLTFKKVIGENAVEKHQLVISTEAGLKNLYINLSETFIEEGLPEIFDWFTVNENVKNKIQISGSFDEDHLIYTLDLKNMVNNYLRANENTPRNYSIGISALDVFQQEIQTTLSYTVTPDLDLMTYTINEVDVWAKRAIVRGFSDPTGTNVYFKYGITGSNENTWTTVTGTMDATGNINALLTGLNSNTNYSFRLYGTLNGVEEQGDVYSFTTEEEKQLPNAGFEDWHKSTSPSTYLVYETGGEMFWDSGNHGGATLSYLGVDGNITTPDENLYNRNGSGNKSAQLKSQFVGLSSMGKFAAGNLFVGGYKSTSLTTMTGTIDFGREFTHRPSKLKGWYKYEQGSIDYSETDMAPKNTPDSAHIYIALGNWSAPWRVDNNVKSTLFDPNDPGVIAYGELVKGADTSGEDLIEFEIELDYRIHDQKPTYIIVVCSASKYGDYFTGSSNSTLWVDDFELIYE